MTPRELISTLGRTDHGSDFIDFYGETYSAVAAELLAFTGDLSLAHTATGAAYAQAWLAWPKLRTSEWPVMWVRADAIRRAGRPRRAQRLRKHVPASVPPVQLHPEDEVLVAALQRLPAVQRLHLVLHYVAQVPVDAVVEWFGGTAEQVGEHLDDGFETLVGILDWPDALAPANTVEGDAIEGDAIEGDAYDWTAEALVDSGLRLRQRMLTPSPTPAIRRAAVTKVARRGAPVTAAAAAAVVGLVAYLSPAPAPAPPSAVAFTDSPAPTPPTGPAAPAPAAPAPAAPTLSTLPQPVRRSVETHRMIATSRVAPSVAAAAGSAVESTIATTTRGTTTPPTNATTTATTTTATASPAGTTTSTTASTAAPAPAVVSKTSGTTSPVTSLSATTTSGLTSTETTRTTTQTTTQTTTRTSETESPDPDTTDPETVDPETGTRTTTATKTVTKTPTETAEPDETETETEETETAEPDDSGTDEVASTPSRSARQVVVGRAVATSALPTEVVIGTPTRHDDGG